MIVQGFKGGRSSRLLMLSTTALVGLGMGIGEAGAISNEDVKPIAQITLDSYISTTLVPGAVAGIRFSDGSTWTGATGYADSGKTTSVTTDMKFRVGSQTKTYTGTVILQMADEGLLTTSQTLQQWLPELNIPNADKVTIDHLLTMRAGIPDYLRATGSSGQMVILEWMNSLGQTKYSGTELVNFTNSMTRLNEPGAQMNYSNTNFLLLSMIAEKASCRSSSGCSDFGTELKRRVLDKLGLSNTSLPTTTAITGPHAKGYYVMADNPSNVQLIDFTNSDPTVPGPSGAMISTVDDELVWLTQLATNNKGLLSANTQTTRLQAQPGGDVSGYPADYGQAIYWVASPNTGQNLVGHSGAIAGYTSAMFYNPALNIGFVANINEFDAYTLKGEPTSAVHVFEKLESAVTRALASSGSCGLGTTVSVGSGGSASCSGDSVRTAPIAVSGGTLNVEASGKTSPGYIINYGQRSRTAITQILPTLSFYGHNMSGVAVSNGGSAVLKDGSIVEITGNNSTAIELSGDGASLTSSGIITASGSGAYAIRGGSGAETVVLNVGSTVNGNVDLGDGANTLNVNGIVNGNVTLSGATRLSGNATINGTVSGTGTLAPGNSIGGIWVTNYVASGTTLETEVFSAGLADGLTVFGAANLTGGTLRLVKDPSVRDGVWTLLVANNLTGTFANVGTSGRVAATADYGIRNVVRAATASPVLQDAAIHTAEMGMTGQFDMVGRRLAGAHDLVAMPEQRAMATDAENGPAGGPGGMNTLVAALSQAPMTFRNDRGFGAWAEGFYAQANVDRIDGVQSYDSRVAGITAGADYAMGNLVMGGFLAYQFTNGEVDGRTDEIYGDSYFAGIYGAYTAHPWFVKGQAMLGWGNEEITRSFFDSGTSLVLTGEADTDTFLAGARVDGGMVYAVNETVSLVPNAALAWTMVDRDSYTETGADTFNMVVGGSTAHTLRAQAGLAAQARFELGGGTLRPELRAAVAHDFALGDRDARARYAGFGSAFTLDGYDDNRFSVLVGGGVSYAVGESVSLFADYDGALSADVTEHRVKGGFVYRF